MSFGVIKNIDIQDNIWGGVTILANGSYTCMTESEALRFAKDESFIVALVSNKAIVSNGTVDITTMSEAFEYLLGHSIKVSEQPPFAAPTYRTKFDATTNIAEIEPGNSAHIDFILTEERYISGGSIVFSGAEMGDYVVAEVHDILAVIPEPARATNCEAWPIVTRYIVKMWIDPVRRNEIDTKPLNAKIPAGLGLRVTYYAVNSGTTRKIGINYNLTKKLS